MTPSRALASIIAVTMALALWVAPVAAQPAGTLVVGLVAEPVNLDPPQVTDLNSNRVGRRIVETLVTFPEESTQIVPGLAESWTISKDGLQYTFKLRRGITFHDGTPLNAEAVKFSIERQINPNHPAYKLGKYPFANFFFGNVKAVEVLSEERVAFLLNEARASFIAVLAQGAASIVSPTAVMKWGPDYPTHPVGTGPFRFASWDRGQRVVLEKNPTYWKYPVKVERVIYRPIVEDQARLTELLTGTLDVIVGVPADFVSQLEQNAKITLLKQVGAHVWYLGMNNQKKPFDDKRVRQALNYAVNKDAIVKDVLKGTGAASRGPVLPGTWGADPALKAYPYDPERAKKLLAEAGYPSGFSTTLWVPESGSGMQAPVAMSTVMQSSRPWASMSACRPWSGAPISPSSAPRSRSCSRCRGWRARKIPTWSCTRSCTRASGRPSAPTAPSTRTRASTPSSSRRASPPTRPSAPSSTGRRSASSSTTRRGCSSTTRSRSRPSRSGCRASSSTRASTCAWRRSR